MLFNPGPIQPLDVDALLTFEPDGPLSDLVAAHLQALDAPDAAIGDAADTMRSALGDADPDTFAGLVDAATGAHALIAEPPDANYDDEIAAAAAERGRLEAIAAVLPSDGVAPTVPTLSVRESQVQSVDVDWDALAGLPGYLEGQLSAFARRLDALGNIRPAPGGGGGKTPQPPPDVTVRPPAAPPPGPIDLPPPIEDNPDEHGTIKPPPDDGSGDTGEPPPNVDVEPRPTFGEE